MQHVGFRPSPISHSLRTPVSATNDADIVDNGWRLNPRTLSTRVDLTPRVLILESCAIECHGTGRLAETVAGVVKDLQSADRRLGVESEAPVEQATGLIPVGWSALAHQPVHHGYYQAAAPASRGADECLARGVGEPGFAADGARVSGQELVVVDDRMVSVGSGGTRKNSRRLGGDLSEHRVGHRRAEDDGQVGGRGPTRAPWPV